MDAFGGVKAVYNDKAKLRALSRLIQCDASDLLAELQIIIDDPKQASLVNANKGQSTDPISRSSSVSSATIATSSSNLNNQRIISFDSPPGTFITKSSYNGRMSEGSYHKFEDKSVHYNSIYSTEEIISHRNPVHGEEDDSLYHMIMKYACCCLSSKSPSDGSSNSLLTETNAASSSPSRIGGNTTDSSPYASPDKFVVKTTKTKVRNSLLANRSTNSLLDDNSNKLATPTRAKKGVELNASHDTSRLTYTSFCQSDGINEGNPMNT